MLFIRLALACCSFLLAANCAQAYQYCGKLPRNSAAFYSCEALNQQERFEQDRKREVQEQEEKRKRDQLFRDIDEKREREKREAQERSRYEQERDEKREREKREAQERSRYEQERTERAERTESSEKQEKMQLAAELLPIIGGVETAKTALEAGKCDQAQRVLDDIQPKIKNTKASYSIDGKVLTREDIENAFVATQLQVYVNCLTGTELNVKLLGYLEQEAKKGNKVAKEFLAEVQKKSGRKSGKNKNVPKFSDYGTDMASLVKYGADLDETSIDACREAWEKKKEADAAYCLARYESGSSQVAFYGADAKSLPMLREAAKLGHPVAQNNLATELAHSKPLGSPAEIARLIRASANSGIPHAQVTVGWWHMTGEQGFKVDHAEAMKWNLKAYKQGHSEGANNIGELYEKGLGVQKDMEQAKSWYKKASVLGNAEANARLEKLGR
jgi:TPR repeat protein